MDAPRAMSAAERPTTLVLNLPPGYMKLRIFCVSAGLQIYAPFRSRCAWRVEAMDPIWKRTDSAVQRTEWSKTFESTMLAAAFARSAVSSTTTGGLPGPTPIAGVPERYAACTTGPPPVARTSLVCLSAIMASTRGIVGLGRTWMTSAGAPALVAAAASTRVASTPVWAASGWGLTTTAFRVSMAQRTLKYSAATGLVEGMTARTTPGGLGTETTFASTAPR